MNRWIYRSMAAATLLLCAAVAAAEDEFQSRYYGGFALAFASADADCDYYGYNCDGTDMGFRINGGKRFHPNLAAEIAWYDLGSLKNRGIGETRVAETQGVQFALLGIIPTNGAGFFYGKAGILAWQADYTRITDVTTTSSEDGTDFTYGAGYAFEFNENYDFRIEFERLNELGDDFDPGGSAITTLNISGTIYLD